MSVHSLTVVLTKDVNDEKAQMLVLAIEQFQCVLTVKPQTADCTSLMAEERAVHELTMRFWDVLHPKGTR